MPCKAFSHWEKEFRNGVLAIDNPGGVLGRAQDGNFAAAQGDTLLSVA
jgi:hypothetical protein